MSRMFRPVLGCFVAIPLLALQGCAMLEGSATASTQAPSTSALGSSASPFVRAALQPFSLSNCEKFDAIPQECERTLKGNE